MTRVRWWMVALLFLGTTLNYVDRIVFSFLATHIRRDVYFNDEVYGYVTGAFQFAYMVGFLFAGKFIDRFGTRIGYAVAITWWSIAAAGHAFAHSALSLGFWRAMLGLGESGNFPAAIKAVAEWFPKKDRAFATGIFNAGSNVASMIGPPALVVLYEWYGWRASFVLTASLGVVLLALWLWLYRSPDRHGRVNEREREYIRGDAPEAKVTKLGWRGALRFRETWGFAAAKFLTDPVWWFYLWWLPLYLLDIRKMTPREAGWALPVVYLMADFGSVAGGWLSGFLIRHGWPNSRARKTAMAVCACAMPISAMAAFAPTPWLAVVLVSLATAGHQGWSANLYTTTSDVFPKNAIASVVGIGGAAGALGGVLFASVIPGIVIQNFGYRPVFLAMGCFHLTALAMVHWLMGDLKSVEKVGARTAR